MMNINNDTLKFCDKELFLLLMMIKWWLYAAWVHARWGSKTIIEENMWVCTSKLRFSKRCGHIWGGPSNWTTLSMDSNYNSKSFCWYLLLTV